MDQHLALQELHSAAQARLLQTMQALSSASEPDERSKLLATAKSIRDEIALLQSLQPDKKSEELKSVTPRRHPNADKFPKDLPQFKQGMNVSHFFRETAALLQVFGTHTDNWVNALVMATSGADRLWVHFRTSGEKCY